MGTPKPRPSARRPGGLPDREPTHRELAVIEAEWPSIETDMTALDAEIRSLVTADVVDELDVRRARRARRVTLRAAVARPSYGGEAA